MRQNDVASVGKLQYSLDDADISFCNVQTVEEIFASKSLCLVKCIMQLATHLHAVHTQLCILQPYANDQLCYFTKPKFLSVFWCFIAFFFKFRVN